MTTTAKPIGAPVLADVGSPTPVISVAPVTLTVAGRDLDLELRVSAPATGDGLPIILLSHGQGFSHHLSSLNGYAPMANFWASHGFVVVQPTHLSSATVSLAPDHPEAPFHWRSRATDMTHILDQLDVVEAAVPTLAGRLDASKVAVVGHSMGGYTASLLLGARVTDPREGKAVDLSEDRIKAGVVLAAPGAGASLLPEMAERFPDFASIDFSTMTTPALVVAGDQDASPNLTAAGPDWHADPYRLSEGPKALLTIFGGEHQLGGVSGYDVDETTDDDPDRVAAIQQLTWAYLRTALFPEDRAWDAARDALAADAGPQGRIESK